MTSTVSERVIVVSIEHPALYLVATPIGNLDDITYRAVAILGAVDEVFAEDTRTSRRLFDHYRLVPRLKSLHEHNERDIARAAAMRILSDKMACALISDAGTPLVSDPGYLLVRESLALGVPVYPVPGPCAAVAALTASGLATDRFVFEGFLPPRRSARVERLQALAAETRTLLLYESPHRLVAVLVDIAEVLGPDRQVAVARELTKRHETHYRGTTAEVLAVLATDPHGARGEFVIVIEGLRRGASRDDTEARRILGLLLNRLSRRDAIELAGAITGASRNSLYAIALELATEAD